MVILCGVWPHSFFLASTLFFIEWLAMTTSSQSCNFFSFVASVSWKVGIYCFYHRCPVWESWISSFLLWRCSLFPFFLAQCVLILWEACPLSQVRVPPALFCVPVSFTCQAVTWGVASLVRGCCSVLFYRRAWMLKWVASCVYFCYTWGSSCSSH